MFSTARRLNVLELATHVLPGLFLCLLVACGGGAEEERVELAQVSGWELDVQQICDEIAETDREIAKDTMLETIDGFVSNSIANQIISGPDSSTEMESVVQSPTDLDPREFKAELITKGDVQYARVNESPDDPDAWEAWEVGEAWPTAPYTDAFGVVCFGADAGDYADRRFFWNAYEDRWGGIEVDEQDYEFWVDPLGRPARSIMMITRTVYSEVDPPTNETWGSEIYDDLDLSTPIGATVWRVESIFSEWGKSHIIVAPLDDGEP